MIDREFGDTISYSGRRDSEPSVPKGLKTVSSIMASPSFFWQKKNRIEPNLFFFKLWRDEKEFYCRTFTIWTALSSSSGNFMFRSPLAPYMSPLRSKPSISVFFSNSEKRKCDLGKVESLLWPHFIVLVEILCFVLLSQDILLFGELKVHLDVSFSNSEEMWYDLGTTESLLWPLI